MPGYTHMQPAQPVTFGHHLMAYVEMFYRDRGRFADARKRLNELPLGAAALAGTPFPIDRDATAKALGSHGRCAIRSTGVGARLRARISSPQRTHHGDEHRGSLARLCS